jgi:hypothetical protein
MGCPACLQEAAFPQPWGLMDSASAAFQPSSALHLLTAQVTYLPAPGWHLLSFQGRWFGVQRRRATGNPQLAANARWAGRGARPSAEGIPTGRQSRTQQFEASTH